MVKTYTIIEDQLIKHHAVPSPTQMLKILKGSNSEGKENIP